MESHKPLNKVKPQRKGFIGLLTLLLLVSGGGLVWKFAIGNKKTRDLSDYIVFAESGSLPGMITSSGELQAVRSVNLSPDRQGLLEDLFVKEGDLVREGQAIAKMDSGDYLYRLKELKADYDNQRVSFNRWNSLFNEGAISSDQLDEYRSRYLISKARLEQRRIEGKDLIIRAPFSGLITTRYAEPGAFVAPTTRASSIAGSSSSSIVELSQGLEVSAKVPESDIGRIRIDQQAIVRVDAFPDRRFKANVSEISPRASKIDNVTSFEVKLSLVSPTKELRIGMTADIDFKTGKTPLSTLVPSVAIVTENGTPGVLVVGQNNQPRFQKVELGTSSGSKTAIIQGVDPGSQIFIDLPPWARKKTN